MEMTYETILKANKLKKSIFTCTFELQVNVTGLYLWNITHFCDKYTYTYETYSLVLFFFILIILFPFVYNNLYLFRVIFNKKLLNIPLAKYFT